MSRERDIIGAFVDLSNDLVDDYDVVEMLTRLTSNCANMLDVASAGLLLADEHGVLHLAASSSERAHHLELFQLQREEGPCLDCYRDAHPIIVPDLAAEEQRWPQFTQAAREVDFHSVHAVPMRLRDSVLGTLGLFGDHAGRLDDDDFALAQALAHVASVTIVNEQSATDQATVNAQLQHALKSRIVVEQAKGIIAQMGGLEMEAAFNVLRRYSRDHSQKLGEIATLVANRDLRGEVLLEHARAAAILP